MKQYLKSVIPKRTWELMRIAYFRLGGRPKKQGETSKAGQRRTKEKLFERYCNGRGLDIGFGGDLFTPNCVGWDFEHGDAQYLKRIPDTKFDFVYSSHTLEHMTEPDISLKNWWRVLKSGGFLILYVPHRDLYEKRKTLPSRWNPDHKHFFLPDKDEEPDTIGITALIGRSLSNFEIVYVKVCSEGYTVDDPEIHSDGEYSIEAVVKKK